MPNKRGFTGGPGSRTAKKESQQWRLILRRHRKNPAMRRDFLRFLLAPSIKMARYFFPDIHKPK